MKVTRDADGTFLPGPAFEIGEKVMLKKKNPFKGSIQCGRAYEVLAASSSHVIIRQGEGNENNGTYAAGWFRRQEAWEANPGADLYDEALMAQETMEKLGS